LLNSQTKIGNFRLLFQKQNVLIAFKQRKGCFLRSQKEVQASINHFKKERWMPILHQQKERWMPLRQQTLVDQLFGPFNSTFYK
jgi:hypothetical protein